MPKEMKVCRVCGDTYEACRTPVTNNAFRWQDVACSPECGAEYLHKIQLSRGVVSEDSQKYVTMYNEDVNGFDEEFDKEYILEFGEDEE